MKVMLAHNRYQQRGGEDVVVDLEYDMLRRAGVDVTLRDVDNNGINGLAAKLQSAVNVADSPWGKTWMRQGLAEVRPDIVHVHNFFPRLTPSIYDACIEAGVPVVQTLHNFRLTCAAGTLMRNGTVCEKCVGGSPYQAVMHRCYRDSTLGSLALARMIDYHRRSGTFARKVDLFIALTEFARDKFVAAGLPKHKIIVKPNTAPDPGRDAGAAHRNGALYVGRLSSEKGLVDLIDAWKGINAPLRIVGTGPLRDALAYRASANVTFLGPLSPDLVRTEMGKAAFLVMPSTCYEGFPMVIAEAYACGLPVLASRIGSLAEIVVPGVAGDLFEAGNSESLAAIVNAAISRPVDLSRWGRGARDIYERCYSSTVVSEQLLSAYERVLGQVGIR
jgi:glycosyltransferase involved in cell wall biosynthesis